MPQKRRRRRLEEDGASPLSGSLVDESDSSSSTSSGADDDGGASWPRYQSFLAGLQLPPSADGDDDPEIFLLPGEVLQALTRRSFLEENGLQDALVEYEAHKCSREETHGQGGSAEFHSASSELHPADEIEIRHEDFLEDCDTLHSRRAPVDEYTKLDRQQLDELYLRHARFRIRAVLLLKGKAIDKLDDAALERKYPRELIANHSYLLGYERHAAFGWVFDSELCVLASLTDYQRLVLFNDCSDGYEDWSCYRSYYNTPETDRDYLLYWEAITEKIKWIEDYIHRGRTSDEVPIY